MKGVLQSPPSLRTGHLTAAMLGREMISPPPSALPPLLPLMTRAAPARAPILRPGVKGAGWAAGRGLGAERIWWGARRARRASNTRNTCREGERERGAELSVRPCQSSPTLHFLMSVATVVWGGLWSWYLTSPHQTISLTPPTRLFILPNRADQHILRLFLLNCYQHPLKAGLENIDMTRKHEDIKTWRHQVSCM